jgi:predicted metal-dependent peptidase
MVSRFKDYYMTSHDWKGDLKKYMGKALSNIDMDTKLGKKKWLAQDQIKKYDKPSENSISSVIFLIDCSGSVSDKLLQNIISECYTICKRKKIDKVTYIYYDDGIRQMETNDTVKHDGVLNDAMVSKIKKGNARPKSEIHGRGGNNEEVVMKELEAMLKKSHKRPELVMWFTDGYTYARPAKPKNIKHMIWVIYDNTNFEVTDGSRVIHIKSEDLGK